MMRSDNTQSLGAVLASKKDEETVFTKEKLKKHLDKVLAAKQRVHDANADVKSAFDAAEKDGIPRKELKMVVKEESNPVTDDFKATVNIMREMLGKMPLFEFADKEAKKAVVKH